MRNTGSPSGDRGVDQLATRERQAGPFGMAERLAVPTKPGNSGGGKGPQLKADARSDNEREIGDKPDNSQVVFRSCRQRHMQWLPHCVSLLREPDVANPQVRFDERGGKQEAWFSK